jgi:calmodulin
VRSERGRRLTAATVCLHAQIMYLRYGRAELDMQLEQVFGTADLNSGKILTLSEFLSRLHTNQVKQLLNRVTAKTYKAPPPPQKRK